MLLGHEGCKGFLGLRVQLEHRGQLGYEVLQAHRVKQGHGDCLGLRVQLERQGCKGCKGLRERQVSEERQGCKE